MSIGIQNKESLAIFLIIIIISVIWNASVIVALLIDIDGEIVEVNGTSVYKMKMYLDFGAYEIIINEKLVYSHIPTEPP